MMLGVGNYDPSTGEWVESGGVPATPGAVQPATNWAPLWSEIIRGSFSLVGSQVQKPTYETHTTPGGSSTILRAGGGSMNYPGTGPTSVPVVGVSTTTMLLLGAAALLVMAKMMR